MKEITLFTEEEKKIMRPLLMAKEKGNHEAAVKFTEMETEGYKRALTEYKKHSLSESVTSGFLEDDELFPKTVADKIAQLEKDIADNEEWLKNGD